MTRPLIVVGLSITISAALFAERQQPPVPMRTVYVTVVDKNGVPVPDLTPSDFAVKEGGKTAEVNDAGIGTDPMQIALIVDDNGTGLFRAPLARFVHRLNGHAAMSLSSVVGQTMKLVDYTLNARPGAPDGGHLLEGILEAALELTKWEARRPVIIALTVGGEDFD